MILRETVTLCVRHCQHLSLEVAVKCASSCVRRLFCRCVCATARVYVCLWHATTARGTRYRRLLLLKMKSHMEEHVAESDVIFGAA